MKPGRLLLIVFALICTITATRGEQTGVSLPEYIRRLDEAILALEQVGRHPQAAEGVARALPSEFAVQFEGRTFRVPLTAVRQALLILAQSKGKGPEAGALRARLIAIRSDALAFQQTPPDFSAARTTLNAILASREFRDVHGPTWLDWLRQRILELLGLLVTRISLPIIGNILVWGLMVAAVVVAFMLALRQIRNRAAMELDLPESLPGSRAKEWLLWMSGARAAAARDNWRDAVHLAYWAGVLFLETQESWVPDHTRTPREYLQLLPLTGEARPALQALTRLLEAIWYGRTAADAAAYSRALAELEKLGCH
jgi:hypothetical protein